MHFSAPPKWTDNFFNQVVTVLVLHNFTVKITGLYKVVIGML